ncbi:MAG TPA: hypothetical protein VE934_10640 [Polaromonas sp.]|uniref:hypothetical protein n=1 Tax=Polaromonas sp. TaxID=1869339 RepID=UPI002D38A016|nr:hypothetical protein [Polaromonas sp.]HYW57410.1 hypothetical protein [Polaromonas sp.]
MQRELKFFGWFALALGCVSILGGLAILGGWSTLSAEGSCRAICGLSMLFAALFGDSTKTLVGGLLTLILGVAFCLLAYRVLK